ncbi:hypothetical protein [Roseibium sp. MMSF_3544]|uniref:hypothetical protein n=1 Tax=unclassified Roseibium TaxID=2629323 RepID=UPI00273D90E9|nr:hypothetical protein [Roseibium sp. MMSF_3544]
MRSFLVAAAVAATSSPALAHPGNHHEMSGWGEAVAHFFGSPFHAALVLGAIATGAIVAGVWRVSRRTGKAK